MATNLFKISVEALHYFTLAGIPGVARDVKAIYQLLVLCHPVGVQRLGGGRYAPPTQSLHSSLSLVAALPLPPVAEFPARGRCAPPYSLNAGCRPGHNKKDFSSIGQNPAENGPSGPLNLSEDMEAEVALCATLLPKFGLLP